MKARLFCADKGIMKSNIEIIFNNEEALEAKLDEQELIQTNLTDVDKSALLLGFAKKIAAGRIKR